MLVTKRLNHFMSFPNSSKAPVVLFEKNFNPCCPPSKESKSDLASYLKDHPTSRVVNNYGDRFRPLALQKSPIFTGFFKWRMTSDHYVSVRPTSPSSKYQIRPPPQPPEVPKLHGPQPLKAERHQTS